MISPNEAGTWSIREGRIGIFEIFPCLRKTSRLNKKSIKFTDRFFRQFGFSPDKN